MKLELSFYEQDVLTVAQELLGKIIVHEINDKKLLARIIDCEAYPGILDRASHTYNHLKTERTQTLYKRAGLLYVYLVYGMHSVANVVCGPTELGGGVMLRAVEAITEEDYLNFANNRFHTSTENLTTYQRKNLLNGPGKLTQALQLNVDDDGEDLIKDRIYIVDDGYSDFEIGAAPRVGIEYAKEAIDYPYRFYMKENPNVTI